MYVGGQGNSVMLVSLLCDFIMCLRGKGWMLHHIVDSPEYASEDGCGSFSLPFLPASPIGERTFFDEYIYIYECVCVCLYD